MESCTFNSDIFRCRQYFLRRIVMNDRDVGAGEVVSAGPGGNLVPFTHISIILQ